MYKFIPTRAITGSTGNFCWYKIKEDGHITDKDQEVCFHPFIRKSFSKGITEILPYIPKKRTQFTEDIIERFCNIFNEGGIPLEYEGNVNGFYNFKIDLSKIKHKAELYLTVSCYRWFYENYHIHFVELYDIIQAEIPGLDFISTWDLASNILWKYPGLDPYTGNGHSPFYTGIHRLLSRDLLDNLIKKKPVSVYSQYPKNYDEYWSTFLLGDQDLTKCNPHSMESNLFKKPEVNSIKELYETLKQ